MPRLVISIDGAIIQHIDLTSERTTLGRRPYNDIVISNLAVSGEHALLHWSRQGLAIEDLHSTNGTYVNQQRIDTRQPLHDGDLLHIGQYQISVQCTPEDLAGPPAAQLQAWLRLEGSSGRQVALLKPVTTLGKPGVAVAAIARRDLPTPGFTLACIEGHDGSLLLNGKSVGAEPQPLQHDDLIELAGSRLRFRLQPGDEAGTVQADF